MAARYEQSNTPPQHELEDYLREIKDIQQGKEVKDSGSHSHDEGTDDELSKTPDDGEQELAWLTAAGFGHLALKYEDGKELEEEMVKRETSSLTKAQAAAVKKRVDTLNATIRKRQKQAHKTDVRDVFSNQQSSPQHGGSESGSSQTAPAAITPRSNRGSANRGSAIISKNRYSYSMTGDQTLQNPTTSGHVKGMISRVEMLSIHPNLDQSDVSLSSSADPGTLQTDKTFVLSQDHLGVTLMNDLGASDLARLRPLALIEFTSLFDVNGISYTRRKPKKRIKDNGIFGVSLQALLDHDQKKHGPHIKVPLIVSKLIDHLETHGIIEEGILRVPGSATRIKALKQEINDKFHVDGVNWSEICPNDAAGLLKLLIRELPNPLLTMEYYDAFAQVEGITNVKDQISALNLLTLLLPDVHSHTLLLLMKFLQKVVEHEGNLMNLNNVAMIMAPNLFLVSAGRKHKANKELEIRMAAGTANIVRMLITYKDLLPVIPSMMIAQIRSQYERDHQKKGRDNLIMKLLGRKDKTDINKRPVILSEGDYKKGVIKVQAPHLKASGTISIELQPETQAQDILDFVASPSTKNNRPSLLHNGRGENAEPSSSAGRAGGWQLYEVGGNIGERRLAAETRMLALLKVNPNAEWIIRSTLEGVS